MSEFPSINFKKVEQLKNILDSRPSELNEIISVFIESRSLEDSYSLPIVHCVVPRGLNLEKENSIKEYLDLKCDYINTDISCSDRTNFLGEFMLWKR